MLKPCCRNLFEIADLFCHLASSFIRAARRHTWQSWLKIGLLQTVGLVNSLVKMNGLRTRLTSTLWTTMSGELCLNATSHLNPSRKTSMSSRKFCSWYGTSCHKTRSTKPYWASRKDFGVRACVTESWWWTPQTYANELLVSLWDFGISSNSQRFLTIKITVCCWLFDAELKIWHRIFIQP